MAILLKNNNDKKNSIYYIKINLKNSIITLDGLYFHILKYPSSKEREKEKNREPLFNKFNSELRVKIQEIIKKIEALTGISIKEINLNSNDDNIINNKEELNKLFENFSFYHSLLDINYKENINILSNSEYINNKNNMINNIKNNINLLNDTCFNIEWITDTIKFISDEIEYICPYNKQDFTLESFYNELKNKYKDDSNIEIIDC